MRIGGSHELGARRAGTGFVRRPGRTAPQPSQGRFRTYLIAIGIAVVAHAVGLVPYGERVPTHIKGDLGETAWPTRSFLINAAGLEALAARRLPRLSGQVGGSG